MTGLRLEITKVMHQRRTYIGWLGLVLVPLIVVAAAALQRPHRQHPGEPSFVAHIGENGLLVMLATLIGLASFLLPIVAAMGGASSVASEAEGGTLKTWLSRPVSRTGVLLTKWAVAVLYALAGAALAAVVSLAAGAAAFGVRPVVTLSGATITAPHALALIVVAYVVVVAGAVCSLTIALFISTLTNSSLTAAIIAIAVFTVLTIFNAFTVFDFMSPYMYSTYRLVFINLFRYPIYWHPIQRALITYAATVAVTLLAALAVFSRKDVLT